MAPMTISLPSAADTFEFGNIGEIDQVRRRGEPQLHHRNKAVLRGEGAAVLPELGQEANCLWDGFGAMVAKGSGYHGHPPLRLPAIRVVTAVDPDCADYIIQQLRGTETAFPPPCRTIATV